LADFVMALAAVVYCWVSSIASATVLLFVLVRRGKLYFLVL